MTSLPEDGTWDGNYRLEVVAYDQAGNQVQGTDVIQIFGNDDVNDDWSFGNVLSLKLVLVTRTK